MFFTFQQYSCSRIFRVSRALEKLFSSFQNDETKQYSTPFFYSSFKSKQSVFAQREHLRRITALFQKPRARIFSLLDKE